MTNCLGTENGWPWLLAITAVPAVFQIVTLPFCPESPKYLLLDKDDEMAATKGIVFQTKTTIWTPPPKVKSFKQRRRDGPRHQR